MSFDEVDSITRPKVAHRVMMTRDVRRTLSPSVIFMSEMEACSMLSTGDLELPPKSYLWVATLAFSAAGACNMLRLKGGAHRSLCSIHSIAVIQLEAWVGELGTLERCIRDCVPAHHEQGKKW